MSSQAPLDNIFAPGEPRRWLEEKLLPDYVRGCRWFGAKARDPRLFEIVEWLSLPGTENARLPLLRIEYADGGSDLYQVPLALVRGDAAREVAREFPNDVVARSEDALLCDALHDAHFRDAVVRLISGGGTVQGDSGALTGLAGIALPRLLGGALPLPSRVLRVEQSNSSLLYGAGLFVKIVRKLEEGVNPDAEILRFLTERCVFSHAPAFGGLLEFRSAGRPEGRLLALATSVVPNEGDAWAFALGELAGFLDRALRVEAAPSSEIFAHQSGDSLLRETIGEAFLQRAAQLGQRTGAMHVALASDATEPEFAPEPLTIADLRELQEMTASSLETVLALARESLPKIEPGPRAELSRLLQAAPALRQLAAGAATEPIIAAKTRHHGDYHLGQVLNTGMDFVIIDFEGEPARALAERRRKRSPLRDVAGMLRSFHYAAHCAIRAHPGDREMLLPWAEQWSRLIGNVFFEAWTESTAGAPFIPANGAHRDRLLSAYLLEKAVYEVGYELNNRPQWVGIPVGGLVRLIGG